MLISRSSEKSHSLLKKTLTGIAGLCRLLTERVAVNEGMAIVAQELPKTREPLGGLAQGQRREAHAVQQRPAMSCSLKVDYEFTGIHYTSPYFSYRFKIFPNELGAMGGNEKCACTVRT